MECNVIGSFDTGDFDAWLVWLILILILIVLVFIIIACFYYCCLDHKHNIYRICCDSNSNRRRANPNHVNNKRNKQGVINEMGMVTIINSGKKGDLADDDDANDAYVYFCFFFLLLLFLFAVIDFNYTFFSSHFFFLFILRLFNPSLFLCLYHTVFFFFC